jgi:hypothetical protein
MSWMRIAGVVLIAVGFLLGVASPALATVIIVNGQTSQNLVWIDLDTGHSGVLGNYLPGDYPRNLAEGPDGTLYSSLNGGNRNIVKMVPGLGGVYEPVDFTPSIGGFGPGQIQFHDGDLYAAGDGSRVIFQYDGVTGLEKSTIGIDGSGNIRGMTIHGDTLYFAEIFQSRLSAFDLTMDPPTGGNLVTDTEHLSEPYNMTTNDVGNLVLTSRNTPLIQEFDGTTGAFIKTLADLGTMDPAVSGSWDILYDPDLDNFFVTAGNSVFRLDEDGNHLQTYTSPFIDAATGVAVLPDDIFVPEPSTLLLAAFGALGVVVLFWRRRRIGATGG